MAEFVQVAQVGEVPPGEGKLVYQMQTREMVPVAGVGHAPTVGSPEIAPHYEEKVSQHQQTYDVYDLTVPIADLGSHAVPRWVRRYLAAHPPSRHAIT